MTPTPPAISNVASLDRWNEVKAPYGPSAYTRVPTGRWRSAALVRPTALAVSRSVRPSGAADSENGLACHQRPLLRNRQMKNWPGLACSRVEVAARCMWTDTTLSDSGTTADDAELVPGVAPQRHDDAADQQRADREAPTSPTSRRWPRSRS